MEYPENKISAFNTCNLFKVLAKDFLLYLLLLLLRRFCGPSNLTAVSTLNWVVVGPILAAGSYKTSTEPAKWIGLLRQSCSHLAPQATPQTSRPWLVGQPATRSASALSFLGAKNDLMQVLGESSVHHCHKKVNGRERCLSAMALQLLIEPREVEHGQLKSAAGRL